MANAADDFFYIQGPGGVLEARLDFPAVENGSSPVAVLCHPHPLYGGTLQNKVVHTLAHTCNALGAVAVRFNFRGVGRSEGEYADALGETDDLHAVVAWVQQRWPERALWLGGFSFGAYVALRAAARWPLQQLITIAPPVNLFAFDPLAAVDAHWLLVQGGQDEIVPRDAVLRWVEGLEHPPQVLELPEAGHFFHGRLNELRDAILEALR